METEVVEYRYKNIIDKVFHGIVYNHSPNDDLIDRWGFVKVFENTIEWHEPIGLLDKDECILRTFNPEENPEYFI